MIAFDGIPLEMRDELVAGVEYIKTLANRFKKLNPMIIEVFGEILAEILCHKYIGHWHPDKPIKGREYRCIIINRQERDESILEACTKCGLSYKDLSLPKEMTLWIDPYEVSCRILQCCKREDGESGLLNAKQWKQVPAYFCYKLSEDSWPYTVATFDSRTVRIPSYTSIMNGQEKASTDSKCSTPTPEEDSSASGSSLPLSPSVTGDESDSGYYGSCEDTNTPPASFLFRNPTEENIWWTPVERPTPRASTAIFRTSSPLWIPGWRAAQFYHRITIDPQQAFWL